MSNPTIPSQQMAALVRQQGDEPVEFVHDYPVGKPGVNEILAKVLYTGVCQSDLHTKKGTAASAQGQAITNIKLPHVGGHEGIGRIVQTGPHCDPGLKIGQLVGIRFASRACGRCPFCIIGRDQHCQNLVNHLHHEDGAFQEYIVLNAGFLTLLPDDIDPRVMGPVLCAGVTAYSAVKNAEIKPGNWVVISGAAGGVGHLAGTVAMISFLSSPSPFPTQSNQPQAIYHPHTPLPRTNILLFPSPLVQYAHSFGGRIIAIDSSSPASKESYITSLPGVEHFVSFTSFPDAGALISHVKSLTPHGLGVHAAIVAAGSSALPFTQAAHMLRPEGTLCCCGIPPPDLSSPPGAQRKDVIQITVGEIAIRGIKIKGNLVGDSGEIAQAVELVRAGYVKPKVEVRGFEELDRIYGDLERGEIIGRVVVKVAKDEGD